MSGETDLARPAALMAEPARAAMLLALLGGRSLPASELARVAGVSAPTASGHLARLTEGGLLDVHNQGRHRYFALRGPEVAAAIEALALLAPRRPVNSLRTARTGRALSHARTCYDHLAGRVGVALTDALVSDGAVAPLRPGEVGRILAPERPMLTALDFDDSGRRPAVRGCLDWTERRPHIAGGLGAALLTYLEGRHWLARARRDRSVQVTPAGLRGLADLFGISETDLDRAD